jgi:integrase
VQEGYLACLKAVCNWGVSNRRLEANPVAGITVAIPKQAKTRVKYFTAEEATVVLKAALEPQSGRITAEMKAAYRWVPWICAYTGARVGEITQLRKQDIEQHGGHWLIKITPDAGTTKNAEARYVAIHPHLVEQGFLSFVAASKDDAPLFYNPGRKRGGTKGHEQYNKVSEKIAAWVRKIGVDDPRIQPNHAWRHGFKTRARKVKMDVGARDYMQGHVAATEGEEYGEFEADVLMHEISKLPRFEV